MRASTAPSSAPCAAYASKAFLCTAMARLVAEEGLGLDVATGGELHVALHAGFPADRITFHGNNKSDAELRRALDAGIGRIAVDSFDEIDRLGALGGTPAIHVRVTPGVAAYTHEFIETGTEDSKFGFGLDNGDALEAVRRVLALGGAAASRASTAISARRCSGRLRSLARSRKWSASFSTIELETGSTIGELNVGGGLGVRYLATDDPPTIPQYAALLREAFDKALAEAGVRSRPVLMVEPGRSIAAPAAVTLYRVGTVKAIPDVRTYVAVDGGMSDNLRPVAYGARYEAFLPERARAERALTATIAGKHCEQGDLLVRDAQLPIDVAVGELLATPVTGAYGQVLASNYNKVLRPAVVFVGAGAARVVVRRETDDDLVRLDQP